MGNNLRKIRRLKDITQQELAEKVGVTREYISNIERGVVKAPSARIMLEIAKRLDTTVEKILDNQ